MASATTLPELRIDIHDTACRGCEMCIEICPTEVFEFDSVRRLCLATHPENCIACLSCAFLCPSGAIEHANYHVVKNFYRDVATCDKVARFL